MGFVERLRLIKQVYLAQEPVDFRKSIDGLSALVEQTLQLNLFEPTVFVFVNRGRTKIKALYWHRSGFCLWYKRLEAQKFAWPTFALNSGDKLNDKNSRNTLALEIDMQQLEWLLEGFDLWQNKPHKTLEFVSVS
jgi:transposase